MIRLGNQQLPAIIREPDCCISSSACGVRAMELDLNEIIPKVRAEAKRRADKARKLVDPETLARAVESHVHNLIYVEWAKRGFWTWPKGYPDYVLEDIASRYPGFVRFWEDYPEDPTAEVIQYHEALSVYLEAMLPARRELWWMAVTYDALNDPRIQRMRARLNDKALPIVEHRSFEEWWVDVTGEQVPPLMLSRRTAATLPTPERAIGNEVHSRFLPDESIGERGHRERRAFPPKIEDWSHVLIVLRKWEEHQYGQADIYVKPSRGRGAKGTQTFEQLGFADKRAKNRPTRPTVLWGLLVALASDDVEIGQGCFRDMSQPSSGTRAVLSDRPREFSETYEGNPANAYEDERDSSEGLLSRLDTTFNVTGKLPDSFKKRISRLNERLKMLFRTEEQAIEYIPADRMSGSPGRYRVNFRIFLKSSD